MFCSHTVHRMDQVVAYVKPVKEFMKDSKRLVQRCTKPDLKGKPSSPKYVTLATSCLLSNLPLLSFWRVLVLALGLT